MTYDRTAGGTATYHSIMAWSASVVMHFVLASSGAVLATSSADVGPRGRRVVETRKPTPKIVPVEVPALLASALEHWRGPAAIVEPELGGGERMPRPDTGHAGLGGDAASSSPAINLAARDDEAHLTPLLQSRLERAQHARHREGDQRQSPEDDTVSDRPMIATIFVIGSGTRYEQRPFAPRDPGAGSFTVGSQMRRGGLMGQPLPIGIGLRARPIPSAAGNNTYDAFGGGTLDSWWGDSGYAADVMTARPFSLRGRTASFANNRGEHEDVVDSEQEDTTAERNMFHASTAGGPAGDGLGGQKGRGPTGSGGERDSGSRSRAMGTGKGPGVRVDPADRRRRMYRRLVSSKIQASWSASAFPKKAVLEGKNGYTIVSFVIHKNGTVSQVRTVRNSGYPTFDAKMRAAVRRAAPFGPLPVEFGGSLRISHPFRVDNPAVR